MVAKLKSRTKRKTKKKDRIREEVEDAHHSPEDVDVKEKASSESGSDLLLVPSTPTQEKILHGRQVLSSSLDNAELDELQVPDPNVRRRSKTVDFGDDLPRPSR